MRDSPLTSPRIIVMTSSAGTTGAPGTRVGFGARGGGAGFGPLVDDCLDDRQSEAFSVPVPSEVGEAALALTSSDGEALSGVGTTADLDVLLLLLVELSPMRGVAGMDPTPPPPLELLLCLPLDSDRPITGRALPPMADDGMRAGARRAALTFLPPSTMSSSGRHKALFFDRASSRSSLNMDRVDEADERRSRKAGVPLRDGVRFSADLLLDEVLSSPPTPPGDGGP